MGRPEFALLLRRSAGIGVDDPAWDCSMYFESHDRLLEGAAELARAVLYGLRVMRFLSTDHFSVDGTLTEAGASAKKFRANDGPYEPPVGGEGNVEADFQGQPRSNETHASTTDSESRFYSKCVGKEAKRCFTGDALTREPKRPRSRGLPVAGRRGCRADCAARYVEPHADRPRAIKLRAEEAYVSLDPVNELRAMSSGRSLAIDGRSTLHSRQPHDNFAAVACVRAQTRREHLASFTCNWRDAVDFELLPLGQSSVSGDHHDRLRWSSPARRRRLAI